MASTDSSSAEVVASSTADDDLGLPGWINDLLKPGVGQGVFMTLKISLVCLVLTLCSLLMYIEDEVPSLAVFEPALFGDAHALSHQPVVH